MNKPNHSSRKEYLPFGKPNFSDKEIEAAAMVLRSGWIGMGPQVIAFEKELAEYLETPFFVTVNSCTSALFLSLLLHDIGPGDEVIVPSLTWCSSANAALYLGAKPVFCDIDPATLCVTPESIQEKISPRTKAVVVVHFGGHAVEVDEFRASLPKRIAVIEDAAHALTARFKNGKPVGSSGNATCFSFYANKNLSTGEGGGIALADPKLAERARSLRQHGLPSDAWKRFSRPHVGFLSAPLEDLGYKMNYTDLQAAIGRVQLKRQKEFQKIRLAVARRYENKLRGLDYPIRSIVHQTRTGHARHLFVIEYPSQGMPLTRDDFFVKMRRRNVGVSIHYSPLHLMPLYNRSERQPALPNTEAVYARIVTLPISASMTLGDADYVMEQIRDVLSLP